MRTSGAEELEGGGQAVAVAVREDALERVTREASGEVLLGHSWVGVKPWIMQPQEDSGRHWGRKVWAEVTADAQAVCWEGSRGE